MRKIVLFFAILAMANAVTTETTTTFGSESVVGSDEYGNSVYQRDVTIQTTNFKVDNFWSKFFDSQSKQSNHATISKTGTLRIIVEATSACTLDDTLPKEGCSGQKPFLINNDVLSNPIDSDEYEILFSLSENFDASDNQSFYPLDILRDEQYYKDPYPDDTSSELNRGFLGFVTSALDTLFSKVIGMDLFGDPEIADVKYTPRSDVAVDRRQRYITNIVAGIEKKYRMTKEYEDSIATPIDAPEKINEPASLLHYAEAEKTTESEQCKLLFMNLSDEGLLCRVMSGFGMDAWMPFFNQSKTTKIEVNTIMADTENALLAMTSQIEEVPYLQDIGGSDDEKLSFLQNILKPVATLTSYLKNILFGSSKQDIVATPVERTYEYDEDDAMTMNIAITNDGTRVDDFANFKLLKIRSIYGDMINSCKVKKSWALFSPGWTKTFVEGGTQSVMSPDGELWSDDEWISWCQEATASKGIFDALFDWLSGGVFNPINWISSFFNIFLSFFSSTYNIEDFTNTIKRKLILNVKKVDLNPISNKNSQKIETIKIR